MLLTTANVFAILVLIQVSIGHTSQQLSALKRAIFENYQNDVKPDGQVVVKGGMSISHFSLCPERKVTFQITRINNYS